MSTSSFSFDGLISGLKTGDIIDRLMQIERQPVNLLQQQKSREQARQAAWAAVKSGFSSLQSAVQQLTLRATINAKSVSTSTPSTSPTIVSATANADAANGAFTVKVKQLATQTVAQSNTYVGSAIDATASLSNNQAAGWVTAVDTTEYSPGVNRYFTINGVKIEVQAADTTNTLLARIKSTLEASLGGTWTPQLTADSLGRANNAVQIVPPVGTTVVLGAANDTSNFLQVANLLGATAAGDGSVTSTRAVGGVLTNEVIATNGVTGLSKARLATPISGLDVNGKGSFTINGVSIAYSDQDTVNGIVSRINASNAGVQASYDLSKDRLVLTSVSTGPRLITVADVTGNFLQATKVANATGALLNPTYGQNAIYSLNGGADQTSDTNTISNAVTGVTLNLQRAQALADDPVTVTVAQDTTTTVNALQSFVTAFNSIVDVIAKQTAYDQTKKQGAPLSGDSTVLSLERQLRSLVSATALGVTGKYQSLADIGVSTGAFGSAIGTTDKLQLDSAKLQAALADNPQAVETLVAGLTVSVSNVSTGGNISSLTGKPTTVFENGTYTVRQLVDGTADVYFTNSLGTQYTKKNLTFTAGAPNAAAIAGVTLNMANPLTNGVTDTFDVTIGNRGVAIWLKAQVDKMLGLDGVFKSRDDGSTSEIQAIDKQIAAKETQLTERQQALQQKFASLEATLAKIQSQSASVSAGLARLGQ